MTTNNKSIAQNIRDLVGANTEGLSVDGICVTEISKGKSGYIIHLGNGELIPIKGHQKLENVRRHKPASSHYRIRQYGEFGSTIN